MRQSRRLTSIAPNGDETVYLVADDFGRCSSEERPHSASAAVVAQSHHRCGCL